MVIVSPVFKYFSDSLIVIVGSFSDDVPFIKFLLFANKYIGCPDSISIFCGIGFHLSSERVE